MDVRTKTIRNSAENTAEIDLSRLRSMVEQSEVNEARVFVKEMEARWPDDQRVQHWARVLAPPVARVLKDDPRMRPLDQEHNWLRDHARHYPGQWLAVLGDQLLAVDPDLHIVLREAEKQPGGERALLHFQPGRAVIK